jgi:uncharacterized protein YkwD
LNNVKCEIVRLDESPEAKPQVNVGNESKSMNLRAVVDLVTAPMLLRFFSPAMTAVVVATVALLVARAWNDADAIADESRPILLQREALGTALHEVESDELAAGVVRLVVALEPTRTPTPTRTSVPTPTAVPVQVEAPAPIQHETANEPELPPPASPPDQGGCSASMGGLALAFFNNQNQERTSRGIAPLAVSSCATRTAQLRASDMAARGYFSHTSPDGQTAFTLLDSLGVAYGWAGENIARNSYPGSEAIVVALHDFMASSGHRDNILSTNFTHAGVGLVVDGAGVTYISVVFISL